MRTNCLIVQSGGPTSVINSTLCGIIEEAFQSGFVHKVYGSRQGIYGLLHGDYADLGKLSEQNLARLRRTPGIALGSWRSKLSEEDIHTMVSHMQSFDIGIVFYIGGNGSMKVAHMIYESALSRGYPLIVIGVPKTIDNDIMHTHHTPGFGSAAKFVGTCIMEAGLDIYSLWHNQKITIVETMGRNTGWLAASSALARLNGSACPHRIYIPESPFSIEAFLRDIQATYREHGYAMVVVSEGIRDANGRIVGEDPEVKDRVGRPGVGGVSAYLTRLVQEHTGYSARYAVPSIWQRTGMHMASATDANEAYLIGKEAVRRAAEGVSGMMITLRDAAGTFGLEPLANVAETERPFPLEWYNAEENFVTSEFVDYVLPLIQGEVSVEMHNGLPVYQHALFY